MAYDLYCLVKDRMERAGRRRVVSGAQSLLALRRIALSGLWEELTALTYVRENLRRRDGIEAANDAS